MPVEGRAALGGKPGRGAWAPAGEGFTDLDVAGVRQRGELFGRGGVGQADAVAQDGEVRPSGRGEEGDQRQPRGRVDQLVEPRCAHPCLPDRRTSTAASHRTSIGPTAANTTAPTAVAIVAAWGAPAAFRPTPVASVAPITTAAQPANPSSVLRADPHPARPRRSRA